MVIRCMQEQDLEQVTQLEASCFSMPWRRQDFADILTNENRIYLVAEEAGQILGGCMLSDALGEGDISNVAVLKSHRGQGIATSLLTELMQIGVEQRGMQAFTLEVRQHNQAAIRLYEKMGFCSEGIRPGFYDKPKDNACIMWRRL